MQLRAFQHTGRIAPTNIQAAFLPFLFSSAGAVCACALFKKQNHQYYISLCVSPLCRAEYVAKLHSVDNSSTRWYTELPPVMLKEKQLNSIVILYPPAAFHKI
jgi:hypothetical protein